MSGSKVHAGETKEIYFIEIDGKRYTIPKLGDETLVERIAWALLKAEKRGEYRARNKMRFALGLEPE